MRKIFLKIFLYPVFSLFFFIFLAPIIISTKPGQKQFFRVLSVLTRSTIEADKIKISWFSPQEIERLKIKNHLIDLNIEKIAADDSLIKAIFNKGRFSNVAIESTEGSIKFSSGKTTLFFIPCRQIHLNQVNLQIQTFQKNYFLKNFSLNASIGIDNQLNSEGFIELDQQKGKFSVDLTTKNKEISNFFMKLSSLPVSIFDEILQIFDYNYSLSSQIGKSLNGSIHYDKEKSICNLSVDSDYAKLQFNTLTKSPFSLIINTPGEGKKQLFASNLHLNFLNPLKSTADFQLTIEKFSLNFFELSNLQTEINLTANDELKCKGFFFSNSSYLKGKFSIDGLFNRLISSLEINLRSSELDLYDPIERKLNPVFNTAMKLNFNESKWNFYLEVEKFLSSFGREKIIVDATTQNASTLLNPPKDLQVNIDSNFFKFKTDLNLNKIVRTKSNSPFFIEINPSILKTLQIPYPFTSSVLISGEIEKYSSLDEIKGNFFTDNFSAKFSKNFIESTIKKGRFTIDPRFLNGEIHFTADCSQGELEFNLTKDSKNEWIIKSELSQIPIDLFECFFKSQFDLGDFLGNKISGFINYHDRILKKSIEVQLQTDFLETKFAGILEGEIFSCSKPSKLVYKCPPRSNLGWFDSPSLFLVSEPKITLEFQDLTTSLKLVFSDIATKGKLIIEDLKFYHNHEIGVLEKVYGEWKKKKDGSFVANLNGISPIGKIESSLEIDRIHLNSLRTLIPSFSGSYYLHLQEFPTLFIKAFVAPFINQDIAAILGEKVNLDYTYLAKGFPKVMDFTLKSTSCDLMIQGMIDGDSFNLIKPISGNLEINNELKKLVLDLTNIEIVDSLNPIHLEASARGFSIPIVNPDLKTITIPYFTSDIGKLFVKNSGTLSLLDQFLKTKLPSKTQLWFTPIEGRLNNGILSIARFDVLVSNNLPVAFWGKIDFNKRMVNCTIGLSAQSLKNTLGIKGLPEDFYLTIPIKGPFGKVKIDKTKVLTKISALIASLQKFTGKLGGVLNLMNELMNDQGKIPKAKRPFPWEIPLSSSDIQVKKIFPIEFKKQQKEEEFLSYSVSIDPLLNLLQEQINLMLTPEESSSESIGENTPQENSQGVLKTMQ